MIMQTTADTTRNRFRLIMFHPPNYIDNDNRYHYIKQPLQINYNLPQRAKKKTEPSCGPVSGLSKHSFLHNAHADFRANLHFLVIRIPVQLLPRIGMMGYQLSSDAEGVAVRLLQLLDDCEKTAPKRSWNRPDV
jgi:hypothetical protein